MIPTRQVLREAHIADILLKSDAALSELHGYYKFGRHDGTFVEKPYFLLSHCAHILFSLWLIENESPSGLFGYSAHLSDLASSLDFNGLRYTDYKRRATQADAYQEHLKNEPKWFTFWLKALETQDETRPLNCQEFSRRILTYVSHPGFLEGKISRKSRKPLADLMKTDSVARILCRSMSILEEMIGAIASRFTTLDQSQHTTEQLASLICMLHQIRRAIVTETPAQGPYVLLSNKNWGVPSTLFRVYGGRIRGTLKVVPKRDGGSIVCSYKWTSGSQSKCRSWTRDTSALTHPYEEELFKTWSHDTGEPLHNPEPSPDPKAYWLVQNAEGRRLGAAFGNIEATLKALATTPRCGGLIADFVALSIDDRVDWQDTKLEWTYIKKLDQLLNKLKFAYREASVLGGKNPGEEVISNMWPTADATSDNLDTEQEQQIIPECPLGESDQKSERQETLCRISDAAEPDIEEFAAPEAEVEADPIACADEVEHQAEPSVNEEAEEGQGTSEEPIVEEAEAEESTVMSLPGEEPSSEPGQEQPHSDEAPACEFDRESEPQETLCRIPDTAEPDIEEFTAPEAEVEADPIACADEVEDEERVRAMTDPTSEPRPKPSSLLLKQKLSQWHHPDNEPINYDPLSLKQLQQELNWTQSAVQRMMTDIFGRRPFSVYKGKCKDKTVCDFLEDCGSTRTEPQEGMSASAEPDLSMAIALSDRMFCQYLSQKPQTDTETNPETIDTECSTATETSESSEPERPEPVKKIDQADAHHQLLNRLLEHHHDSLGAVNNPLSLGQLRQDLRWTSADVQRTMSHIFGGRPFTAYKRECREGKIADFLEDCNRNRLDRAGSQHAPQTV